MKVNLGTFTKYIGTPYEEKNCWDLLVMIYEKEFGISLSHVYSGADPGAKEDVEVLISSNKGRFQKVTDPGYGDLIPIRLRGIECHLGMYLDKGLFLHTIKGSGCVVEKISKYEKLIVGYYRHRGRA